MKMMKLIWKFCFLVLPMVLVWIYTWSHPLAFMDQEAPYYLWNKEKVNMEQEKTYDTIILGDSTANAAFVPELLADNVINLALGGSTPVENYYILKEWLDKHKAPDTCYISFLDVHFLASDCFWTRTMYSHRFPMHVNLEILKDAVQCGEESIAREGYIADFISYQLYLPNKYIASLMNAGFNQRYTDNVAAQQLNNIHGGRYIARGTGEYVPEYMVMQDEFCVKPFFDKYYRKLVQLCIDNGIQVRIVKLPLPDNKGFSEKYQAEFDTYYQSLKEMYPEITVDSFHTYETNYFADEVHLNAHGALRFSTEIKELYAADFDNSVFSAERIAGINDSIVQENRIEQILQWIAGKDYAVVFSDATGRFEDICGEIIKRNDLNICRMDDVQLDSEAIAGYVIRLNGSHDGLRVYNTDDGLLIELENQESQLMGTPEENILNIAVVDNYNGKVICTKSFKYSGETFSKFY